MATRRAAYRWHQQYAAEFMNQAIAPHVRIERGMGNRAARGTAPLTTND
jgi:hypothetical protein